MTDLVKERAQTILQKKLDERATLKTRLTDIERDIEEWKFAIGSEESVPNGHKTMKIAAKSGKKGGFNNEYSSADEEAIVEYIRNHPGTGVAPASKAVGNKIGRSWLGVRTHIYSMVKRGQIKAKGGGKTGNRITLEVAA